jgi:YaaC-like Protein
VVSGIRISDKLVRFPRAISPELGEKRVIASSPWEFVALWLKQQKQQNAIIYWEQAKSFFDAASNLPVESAPLPLYYCFLNAVKTLLEVKNISYRQYHGVSGLDIRSATNGRIRIDNEGLKIKNSGILPSLVDYLGETETKKQYNLGEVLSNLPFIHRAVSISYSRGELFLRIRNPRYVTDDAGNAWFRADLPEEHTHGQTISTLQSKFKFTRGDRSSYIDTIDRFPWSGVRKPTKADILALKVFHKQTRLHINYIASANPLWYVKRELSSYTVIDRYNMTLIFLAMHRLSEIARYKPIEFIHILEGNRNWIIYEFVKVARNQFLDEIASEITGYEISPAGVRQSTF